MRTAKGVKTGRAAAALAGAAVLIAAATGSAMAAEGNWYASANLPLAYIDDTETRTSGTVPSPQGSIEYTGLAKTEHGTGIKLGGAVGYEFESGFRAEVEAFGAIAEVDKLTYGGVEVPALRFSLPEDVNVPVSGKVRQFGISLNAWYDFRGMGKWTPWVGGGIGLIRVDQKDVKYDEKGLAQAVADALNRAQQQPPSPIPPGVIPKVSTADNVLAFQIGAGVSYALSEQWSIHAGYRLQQTGELKFEGRSRLATAEATTKLRTHFLEIGVRYAF